MNRRRGQVHDFFACQRIKNENVSILASRHKPGGVDGMGTDCIDKVGVAKDCAIEDPRDGVPDTTGGVESASDEFSIAKETAATDFSGMTL